MRLDFEDASLISYTLISAKYLRAYGIQEVIKTTNLILAMTGWTHKELCDESARRVREKIANLNERENLRDRGDENP